MQTTYSYAPICTSFKQADVLSDFGSVQILGTGSTSIVKEYKCKKTGTHVAIKRIPKTTITQLGHRIQNEIQILKKLSNYSHRNIIQLFEVYENSNSLCLVMELMKGDLFSEVLNSIYPLTERIIYLYFQQIVEGLKFLHSHGIVHRDLKCDNILVCYSDDDPANCVLKIGDFGLSKMFKPNSSGFMNTRCGSLAYAAPEIILGKSYTKAADLWSLGVVLYMMSYETEYPFPIHDYPDCEIQRRIVAGIYSFPEDKNRSSELKSLISGLLCTNPEERLTFEGIENHPWMRIHKENEANAGKPKLQTLQTPLSPVVVRNSPTVKPKNDAHTAGAPVVA